MRFNYQTIVLLAGVALLSSRIAYSGNIYVISHADMKLDAQDIRDIYLGYKEFGGNIRFVPVDNQEIQADFLVNVVGIEMNRYNSVWIKKAFREALNPPLVKMTDRDVLDFVKRTPGAIGYISVSPGNEVVVIKKY